MFDNQIKKPKQYKKIKKKIAKEYFILKRKFKDVFSKVKFSNEIRKEKLQFILAEHKSTLLRQLKNVDMYLQHNKTTNLKLAFSTFNGIIIKPNETFSFWTNVGRPTKRKGYLEGLILTNGQIGKGVGGGLCQLGNLLYWLVLHSPLEVTERWRHSYDVFPDVNRKIPFGSGATLSYNYVDLQVFNPTNITFQLIIYTSEKFLYAQLLSDKKITEKYEVFETDHKIVRQYWGGYTRHNKIWKKIISLNGEEKTELVAENHAIMMYEPMLEEHK
ncbi:MAG: VanW family protein [Bacteroidales bacterium]|nr:VanW family protein [Bacteroidales bacterium]